MNIFIDGVSIILLLRIAPHILCEACENSEKPDKKLEVFISTLMPTLDGTRKGESGKIGVIGGSLEYTGAPYFAAISSLKAGADLLYVVTTETAAPVIKSFSPDLIVYPLLGPTQLSKIVSLLPKMDLVIIGPGLGREDETMLLIYDIIQHCKANKKPIVIDADGLYAVSKNISVLDSYPSPGVILTPNFRESERMKQSVFNNEDWYKHWGTNVTVLIKGKEDQYRSSDTSHDWCLHGGGSSRRAAGQGDILAGVLGTFYNWAIKASSNDANKLNYFKCVAAYAAAKFTRKCNANAFSKHGRSMVASDMINEFHITFKGLF